VRTPDRRSRLGVLGAGAAACAACCAGPIIGFLAATGVATLLGAVAFGVVGVVAALAGAAVLRRRRRRQQGCAPATAPVALDAPVRKGS
jgi:membrane protein implicated in regulation of membrane protease activity